MFVSKQKKSKETMISRDQFISRYGTERNHVSLKRVLTKYNNAVHRFGNPSTTQYMGYTYAGCVHYVDNNLTTEFLTFHPLRNVFLVAYTRRDVDGKNFSDVDIMEFDNAETTSMDFRVTPLMEMSFLIRSYRTKNQQSVNMLHAEFSPNGNKLLTIHVDESGKHLYCLFDTASARIYEWKKIKEWGMSMVMETLKPKERFVFLQDKYICYSDLYSSLTFGVLKILSTETFEIVKMIHVYEIEGDTLCMKLSNDKLALEISSTSPSNTAYFVLPLQDVFQAITTSSGIILPPSISTPYPGKRIVQCTNDVLIVKEIETNRMTCVNKISNVQTTITEDLCSDAPFKTYLDNNIFVYITNTTENEQVINIMDLTGKNASYPANKEPKEFETYIHPLHTFAISVSAVYKQLRFAIRSQDKNLQFVPMQIAPTTFEELYDNSSGFMTLGLLKPSYDAKTFKIPQIFEKRSLKGVLLRNGETFVCRHNYRILNALNFETIEFEKVQKYKTKMLTTAAAAVPVKSGGLFDWFKGK